MSLEVCILASGSSGNCTVLRSPNGVTLIDIGIGPRSAARRLEGTGVSIAEISAVCLTHLDSDHFNKNWLKTIASQGIRVFCHTSCVEELKQRGVASALIRPFDAASFQPMRGVRFRPLAFEHDQAGSHGFLIDGFACRIGYATDLGRVTDELIERFADLDVLALESNYDPQMQLSSPRPWFLKQRIMGGMGHLSNQQALSAIRQILDQSERKGLRLPSHIVLLHRSRQCNCPERVRKLFSQDARIATRLTLAEQHERTGWLRAQTYQAHKAKQLTLAWG